MTESEYKCSYPVYASKLLTSKKNNFLLVAGGGGTAATGINNTLELFSVSDIIPKSIISISTDESKNEKNAAPMHLSTLGKFIAVGLGAKVKLYEIDFTSDKSTSNNKNAENIQQNLDSNNTVAHGKIRKRQNVQNVPQTGQKDNDDVQINLLGTYSYSDELEYEYLARVAISSGNTLISGLNKDIIIYNIENAALQTKQNQISFNKKYTIPNSHLKEIKDIDVYKNLVCTIARDHNCYIWKLSSSAFSKVWSLKELFMFDQKIKSNYSFQSISWFDHGVESAGVYLITTHSPVLSRSKSPSYICIWAYNENGPEKFLLRSSRNLSSEVGPCKLSTRAIAIDTNRNLLTVGFNSGHVLVYTIPELKPIFKHEPKNLKQAMYVTSVQLSRKYVLATFGDGSVQIYNFKENYSEFWVRFKTSIIISILLICIIMLLLNL